MVLHPVFGASDIVWQADHDQVAVNRVARALITSDEFKNAPFFYMMGNTLPFYHQSLEVAEPEPNFPLFDRLRASGITNYFAFFHSYGNTEEILWADLPPGMAGVLGAFSTRRVGGFTDMEIEYLKALSTPLAMAVKGTTTYELAQALLDTYLGKYSGGHVLDGLVERGDGHLIDCVLWYCDLRDSTRLADETPLDDYLATLNDYFDCTAGAVLDHGGEARRRAAGSDNGAGGNGHGGRPVRPVGKFLGRVRGRNPGVHADRCVFVAAADPPRRRARPRKSRRPRRYGARRGTRFLQARIRRE
jgi:adenylate cyclase